MLRWESAFLFAGLALAGCTSGAAAAAPEDAARSKLDPPCSVPIGGVLRSRALSCFRGCSEDLFEPGAIIYDFADPQAYIRGWSGSHVAPTQAGTALRFGPHPLGDNWMENDSLLRTSATYGNAMVCVRLRMTAEDGRGPKTGPDEGDGGDLFQLALRGEAEGMVLSIEGQRSAVALESRRSPVPGSGTRRHATARLAMPHGQQQLIEGLLYGSGSHFIAEVRNGSSGDSAGLSATWQVPANGPVAVSGVRLRDALLVERVIIGTPTARVIDALADPSH
jgi:hypothetical protein